MKKSQRERSALGPFLGRFLFDLRKSESHSQEKFAELLDLSIRSYANDEHGKSLCSTSTLLRVLDRIDDPKAVIHHCVELLDASRSDHSDS